MLKMRKNCERCGIPTPAKDLVFICSFECNFCQDCNEKLQSICPNCDGELVKRPTRVRSVPDVTLSLIKQRKFSKLLP
ncbi:MAG: DUF1272 domain-containing protein [Oleispira sp.]|jgi:hypothetical protein|nr:DUF1272 domain-containing protein [Oleispira sp.]